MMFVKMSTLTGAIIGLTMATLAYAQSGTQGGGDVVVCLDPAGNILKMEAYDFWNASKKFTLTVPTSDIPYMDQARARFERLAKIDPMASESYLNEMKRFAPDEIGKPDSQVALVPNLANNGDGKHVILPQGTEPGCLRSEIRRMASFNPNPLPFEKPFLIMESLWKQAPEHVKAGIVQHELIYRVAKTVFNETDSVNSQFYNALISSDQFTSLDAVSYRYILAKLGWTKGNFYSIAYQGETFIGYHFNENRFDGALTEAARGGPLAKPATYILQGNKKVNARELYFYDNGQLAYFSGQNTVELPGVQERIPVQSCFFSKEGVPLICTKLSRAEITFENQRLLLNSVSNISFYPNGDLKCMSINVGHKYFKYKDQALRLNRSQKYVITYDQKQNFLRADKVSSFGADGCWAP